MDAIMDAYVLPAWAAMQPWIDLSAGYAQMNASPVLALLIALLAVIFLQKWGALLSIALIAAVAHKVIGEFLLPAVQGDGFTMPNLSDIAFWQGITQLYVYYLLVIGVLFVLKRMLMKLAPARAKAH